MSVTPSDPDGVQQLSPSAQSVVEARLGRPIQDMLEAAVVLEAWGGVPASDALASGRAMMQEREPVAEVSASTLPGPDRRERFPFESVAFVIAVLAIACWTRPLAERVGVDAFRRGLVVALPLTLALQWWLRSRYLGRPHGLALLGRRRWETPLGALLLVAVPAAALGFAGVIAGLLALTWSGGIVLIRRGWSAVYVTAVLLATGGMAAGLDALAILVAVAGATALAATAAVRMRRATPPSARPGRWGRAATAGMIGGGVGIMLVADRTAGWGEAAVPALILLPSAVAGLWGGYRLWQFQEAIPAALAGRAAVEGDRRELLGPGLRILLDSVARLVLLTTLLSALLLHAAALAGVSASEVGVLVGFGLVALATLLVSLLEAVGRACSALVAVACAIGAEIVVPALDVGQFAGAGLVAGSGLAVALTLPVAIVLMSRPAATLATTLLIP